MSAAIPGHLRVLSKHRTEALNDGIYAVAMTLLVLELKIPESAALTSGADLVNQLVHLVPRFLAWIISFFILAIFWISHQRIFHFVRVVDGKLLWINVVALLMASLLPFSSSLVGEHSGFFASQAFYAANMAILSLVTIWQLGYLVDHAQLCDPPVPSYIATAARFRCWSLVAVAGLAVLLAALDPRFGTAAFMLMIILSRIGRRIETREAEKLALSSDRPFP